MMASYFAVMPSKAAQFLYSSMNICTTDETRHAMATLATTNLLQALAGQRPAAAFD